MFRSQATTILEMQQLANEVTTFWLIKTAEPNVEVLKTFLEQHAYFGLDQEQIIICTKDHQLKTHYIKLNIIYVQHYTLSQTISLDTPGSCSLL